MSEKVRAKVDRTRFYNPYWELSHANWVLFTNTQEKRDGWAYECMTSILVSAFCFEAFLNLLGEKLFPFWKEVEKMSHKAKLNMIAVQIGVKLDHGKRPYQTLCDLFRFRDALAHPKPENLEKRDLLEEGTQEELRRNKLLVGWEKLCTIEFAEMAYLDVNNIAEEMWRAAGFPRSELIRSDHGYTIDTLERIADRDGPQE